MESCLCWKLRQQKTKMLSARVFIYLTIAGVFLITNNANAIPTTITPSEIATSLASIKPPSEDSTAIPRTSTITVNEVERGDGIYRRKEVVCEWYLSEYDSIPNIRLSMEVEQLRKIENCTIIEGNLEIIWMDNHISAKNYTGLVLPNLVEVTGYLLFYRVNGINSIGQLFPNLRVIRGNWKFFNGMALLLFENDDLLSLSLGKLSHVGGDVLAMVNPQLCYIDDHVDWSQVIIPGATTKAEDKLHTIENRRRKSGCDLVDGCSNTCTSGYCWDRQKCQKDCWHCVKNKGTPSQYNPGCNKNGVCCHDQCLGGCDDTMTDSPYRCFVCKNFFHDGECIESCPVEGGSQLLEYNSRVCITEEVCMEKGIENRYKFHDGKCVYQCPTGFMDHPQLYEDKTGKNKTVRICQQCQGDECSKVCQGGIIQSITTAEKFGGCTEIQGFLEIAITSTENIAKLGDYLSSIREVSDYVKVVRSPQLKTLSLLNNLKTISGERLYADKYSLYVMSNDNLRQLWDFDANHQLTLKNGWMFFQRNNHLCYSLIEKALSNTVFEGHIGGKNSSLITAEAHDQYDASKETNGQYGDCFDNSLYFDMKQVNLFLEFNFSAYNISEDRLIITYIIYYRKVEKDETADYYLGETSCLDDTKLEKWETREVSKQYYYYTDSGAKFYSDFILYFDAFSRYAAYVQTFLTTAVNTDGAKSTIVYFETKASKPSKPRDIIVVPRNFDDNIALEVKWNPPETPNGIITRYHIYYKKLPWRTELIYEKKFCDVIDRDEKVGDTTAAPTEVTTVSVTSTNDSNKTHCDCKDGKDGKEEKTLNERDSDSLLRHDFENYMQDHFFVKNTKPFRRRKRSVDEESLLNPLTVDDKLTSVPVTTLTTAPITTPITTLVTESEESTLPAKVTTTAPEPEVEPASQWSATVNATQTSVYLFLLEPNMEYSIEIVACQAHDVKENVTRCSKRAISKGITKSNPKLDIINASTFDIVKIKGENEDVQALNLSWKAPVETNGPILTYTVRWFDVLEPEVKQSMCIEPKKFIEGNNSYSWTVSNLLTIGKNYNISVRMRTVGTTIGNWTYYPSLVEIPNRTLVPPPGPPMVAAAIGATVAIIFVVLAIVGVCLYRIKKKKPMPLTTLHNSFNPDYMDEVYVPDEWELDRAKVKIGKSLGQGGFGMVYEGEARDLLNTDKKSRKVAIKTVNDTATLNDRIQFLNEASRMKSFKCHHIVQLLGIVSQGQPVLVIMELMALGDLKNYLRMHRPDEPDNDGRKPPTLKEIWQIAAEIADGMAYLTAEKFVHRDLAARNCMVAADMTVKIGDFGMTRDIYDADYYRKGGKGMLPVRWMAPESLRDGVYTSKSDVWSYGVVLWEMATLAAQPYQGFSNEEVLRFVIDGRQMEKPVGCPNRLYEMMSNCWEYYPRYRPSFNNLLDQLQGDVKKNFFSVSWYYNSRQDENSDDDESDSLIPDDRSGETQPLHMGSHNSSGHHIHEADHDLDLERIEDDADSLTSSQSDKDLRVDIPMRPPKQQYNNYNQGDSGLDHSPILNGHTHTSESESEAESSLCCESSPPMKDSSDFISPVSSKPASSVMSGRTGPPSYNTALDQAMLPANGDSSGWPSSGDGSNSNSCNGSANGHLHFPNHLTSAC